MSAPPRSPLPWIALAAAAIGGLWLGRTWDRWSAVPSLNADPRSVSARGALDADETATVELFKRCSPAVVHITRLAVRRDYFSRNLMQIPEGTGSGFLWDDAGHIVTNYHVIQDADAARVTLSDQSVWDARLVGAAPDKDLAVLAIEAPEDQLHPIAIGTSHDLQVGQKAFAIGNPFGLDQSLTTGVISALGREIESVTRRPIQGAIQTDAAVNPGNSGGPLLDSAGRLIGVNTAIYSPSGASAGIGFAIPVDTVMSIVPQLIKYGRVQRPGMGIQIAEDSLARRLGLRRGVLILEVQEGSSADKAGLRSTRRDAQGRVRVGDIVLDIDGRAVNGVNDLYLALEAHKVGDTVQVGLLRDGNRVEVPVVLEAVQ